MLMKRIILDTNSIIFAFSNNVDIFRAAEEQLGAEAVLSTGIIRELRGIGLGRTKEGRIARVALEVMGRHKIELVRDNSEVDGWILEAAGKGEIDVCTNDSELKKRLKAAGLGAMGISRKGVLR